MLGVPGLSLLVTHISCYMQPHYHYMQLHYCYVQPLTCNTESSLRERWSRCSLSQMFGSAGLSGRPSQTQMPMDNFSPPQPEYNDRTSPVLSAQDSEWERKVRAVMCVGHLCCYWQKVGVWGVCVNATIVVCAQRSTCMWANSPLCCGQ